MGRLPGPPGAVRAAEGAPLPARSDGHGPGGYLKGITLDVIGKIADSASPPKPFGIWEMGNTAGGVIPTQSQMQSNFGYLQSFMAGPIQAGKANADLVWFNGDGVSTTSSSSDYRVPL